MKKKNADLHHHNDEIIEELRSHEKNYKESKEMLSKLNEELANVKARVVEQFKASSEFQASIDDAVHKALEDFKSGGDGEKFIEEWKESDDGKALWGEYFEAGFKQFVDAAKKKFPGLTLDLDSVRLEELLGGGESVAAGGDTTDAVKGDDSTGVGAGKDQTPSSTILTPAPVDPDLPASADPDPTKHAASDASDA